MYVLTVQSIPEKSLICLGVMCLDEYDLCSVTLIVIHTG